DNAVVVKDGVILSKDGVRYENEIVRHKMLDIVGDLFLLGCRIKGHVIAEKPGHPSNVAIAQKIIAENPEFFNFSK
ncbi:MAG: UDP-3-O-acyl-N-acetylglucosamine deacetylase, partial [Lentisphaeria bacterium]